MANYLKNLNKSIHFLSTLKNGLIDIVPIFFIGFISSLIISVPIQSYQIFITNWCSGLIYNMFSSIYAVTFGLQAVYALLFYSHHVFLSKDIKQDDQLALVAITVCTFCLFTDIANYSNGALGPKGLIISYISIIISYYVYIYIGMNTKHLFSDTLDSDNQVSSTMQVLIPIFVSVIIITFLNEVVIRIYKVNTISDLIFNTISYLFLNLRTGIFKDLVIIMFSNILWFFGIHGTVALQSLIYDFFLQASLSSTEIFTHSFYTTFILMGGSGVSLCLVLSLLIYGRKKGLKFKKSHKITFLLSLFNVNDFLVFGLPIIYNKALVIPFLFVPVVIFFISYTAMYIGIVPYASNVNSIWMAPIIVSGYLATGSIGGVLLQLFNLSIGTLIYMPFVKKYIDEQTEKTTAKYNALIGELKKAEALGTDIRVTSSYAPYAEVVKDISKAILKDMKNHDLPIYYQPQYDSSGVCIGAEALLRFKCGIHGVIYPPLVFKIAKEEGFSVELDKAIITQVFKDIMIFRSNKTMRDCKTSINVTGVSIQSEEFSEFLSRLSKRFDVRSMKVCLEVTEQDVLTLDESQRNKFYRLHEMGFTLAIDDFSMGNTSAHYLTGDNFDTLKLDGSLVKEIVTNDRTCDIVSSIIELSKKLNLDVIAEYVSNKEIRDRLCSIGCNKYQGYLYSPAIAKDKYISECILSRMENKNTLE